MGIPSPTIPSFTDGVVVHQADLNALANNLTNLYSYNQGGFRTQRDCVLATQTVGQSIANITGVNATFNSAPINTNNMWVAGSNSQLTIQTSGIYWLFGQMHWWWGGGAPTFSTVCQSSLMVNSVIVSASHLLFTSAGSGPVNQCGVIANLSAGAVITLQAYQTTGVAQTLATDLGGTYLGAVFLTASS